MKAASLLLILAVALGTAAGARSFTPWSEAKSAPALPTLLKGADDSRWLAWARREHKTIRARLEQGDLDSMVNLLLYGTSFTHQPRISMERLTLASKSGLLRARVDDLIAGLRAPANNERLVVLQRLLRDQGVDPDTPEESGKFVYRNLLRVVEERKQIADRGANAAPLQQPDDPASLLDRSSVFADRGVSLDTGIIPDFSIEKTLRDIKQRGVLREGQIRRIAVIGPGLDFIDKNEDSAFDYYPRQTVQPFALYDSLLRLKLALPGSLHESIFDISSEVIEHIERARRLAAKQTGYTIQLPRDLTRPWPDALIGYWQSFGDQIGAPVSPIKPPAIFADLKTRATQVRPDVILACEPADLDIIFERLKLAPQDRYDLIVATNIFVYYGAFEQSLALENAGAMLKPGGLLLTNDRLPTVPGNPMQLAGVTVIPFDANAREAMGWYRKTY